MSNQKVHENMEKLDKCFKVVQQNSAKGGINVAEIANKLDVHRTTAYGYLNSLELMGKVENIHGRWRAKTGEQTIKPLEKEIVIELPLPKDQLRPVVALEALLIELEEANLQKTAEMYRILLEKLKETRTIKITGKNVNDLDLENLGNMIQQANEKSSKINLRGLLKSLKRSHSNYSQEDARSKRNEPK